jgi:hypothetical protein
LKRKASVDWTPQDAKKRNTYTDAETNEALSEITAGLTASRWAIASDDASSSAIIKLERPGGFVPQLATLVKSAPATPVSSTQVPTIAPQANPTSVLNTPSHRVMINLEFGLPSAPPTPRATQSIKRKKLRRCSR